MEVCYLTYSDLDGYVSPFIVGLSVVVQIWMHYIIDAPSVDLGPRQETAEHNIVT